MIFVKYEDCYYEWDQTKMRLHNQAGGWFDINENAPEWLGATTVKAENWHDLYKQTGWTNLKRDITERCLWLDPEGGCWKGDCHEIDAADIVEVLYGEDLRLYSAGDYLYQKGWVKLSATMMFTIYCDDSLYDNVTFDQACTIKEWCEYWELPISKMLPNYEGE